MDRIRDGRRGGGVSVGGGPPPPPPRRRLRSNGGGGGGPRDSPRSERRRGDRLMLNGGGGAGRDDGDDTSDDSLGDDDDDAEEELAAPRYQPAQPRRSPSTAPPPPSSPPQQQHGAGHHHSSGSSGGGGGYHNHHHHHHHGLTQQMQRKGGGASQKSPIVLRAADEMIGVPVPRKARSASTKRSSHEWPVPGGGSSGGGAGDGSQIQRSSSRPISPASASTTAPARKKLKPLGSGGSTGGSGPAPKQRPSSSSTPSTAPPQPPPAKISKSPSFIEEEYEVAEVLFGLTRQFPAPPKQENNHKLEHRDAQDPKPGNSPARSSSGVRPSDSSSLGTIAPKRKRPRLVKYDEESRPASPAKPETAEPSSRQEAPPAARSEAKASTSAATESGANTAPDAAPVDASREANKTEDRERSRDSELRTSESDRRDHKPESRPEPPPPPPPSGKPDGEATLVGSVVTRNGEATTRTKIELASDGARQEKFCIDLMAPPPGKLSPDRDGTSDPDADKKGLDSEIDMSGRVNLEKKDGERSRRGLDIDLEDSKVQRIPADELPPRKLTLQLDLEKPSLGDEKSPTERPQPPPLQQQQKFLKSEIKHEKSAMPAVTPPMPLPVGGWLGSFPPFGYLGPVPALSASGLQPMDVKPGSSSGLPQAALIPPPPTRSKRCATHCFVAQLIQYHQRIAKMNSFWPPAAATAATANRSGPFFGPRPAFNMGVVPPTDAASLLVNPMQGSCPVRGHAPLQESKAATMASSPFQGGLSKDKVALGNAAGAESSQRKQPPAHETQQSTPMPNMLQGPAFIFPFNQQQAAAMAAANAANRIGDAKSSGANNAMQPPANAHATAGNPGAAAMNLSFANLQPADAQFLAILQNGAYPFQVAAHAGGPHSYRGMTPPGPAVPYFNGHVYPSHPSHMLHPSQQQGTQQQSLQKNPVPSLSNSSQKHQPQQSQGLLGYTPNANPSAAAASNSQNYSSGNQRSVVLPGLSHRQVGDKTRQDVPSSDGKPSHPQKGGYDHNFAVPHLPNFALAQAAGSQSEKKSNDHHNQQQHPQASRSQGVRIDLASSQPFVMPFGSIGPPGSASTGLDFSSLAQSHAMFQSHNEAARHGYPQLNFAAAQSAQATQHKPQHQITGESRSVAGDASSTPSAGDNERKKSASTKYMGDSQQHSLSFSRAESKSYGSPFLSSGTNESSSRTLSLIGTESPKAFGSKSTSLSTPVSAPAAASSTISQMQHHQQQQHFLQMQQKNQQQFIQQQHHLNRPRSAAPSTSSGAGGYTDRLSVANFPSMMYPSGAAQGGAPGQSQLKGSSARATASSAAMTSPAAPPPNLIVMKNSGLHQQQAKGPMQALSSPIHQSPSSLSLSSSKMGPSVTNISTGGDMSRSSNAPAASGSPSNSVSKSTGGSPPAAGSAKGVQQSIQLSSPQHSAKNPASTSGSKSTPTSHYIVPMPAILGQQPNVSPASNLGSKQQSHMPPSSVKHQTIPQGHYFIPNTYDPQAPGPGAAAALGLYQKRPADKTQQQNAMSAASKALHPASGGFMHLAAEAQSAGGVPHTHMSTAQLTFGAMPMPVKPSSDQKPAAGK